MKLLLVEDDPETAAYIERGLRELGHGVDRAGDGHEGLMMALAGRYDLLVVDRMLPGLEGIGLVKALRAARCATPILILTALDGVGDRITGLDAGADDYLAKPFAFGELVARINALARRPPPTKIETVLRCGGLELNLLTRSVHYGERPIALQPREFRLLEVLLRHAGQIVTRTMLLEEVWDFHFDPRTSVVDTHISRLRAKLAEQGAAGLIATVRGAGYVLQP